jgi:RimJ/RimL family protein N-acetyltransferase
MIILKPLLEDNINPFFNWLKDEEVIKYSLTSFQEFNSENDIRLWYSNLLSNHRDYTTGIFLSSNDVLVGYAGICNISNFNRSGEYFVFIGDKTQWGNGIGTITTKKVIEYGFEKLNLNRIMLTVSEPNIGGIRAYEKAGFKFEGRLRQACFREGKYHDKIMMSLLRDEWEIQV